MAETRKLASLCGAAGIALFALSGAALADGEPAAAAAPADEGRKFTYSFSIAGTSDYVFRGISQTDNDPAIQGAVNIGYGIFYAGWWASQLDFSAAGNDAQVEMDWTAGIHPVWGKATFDLGTIYYSYPGSNFIFPIIGPQLPYWEIKAGVSGEVVSNLTAGVEVYWSPDYFGETGNVWTVEGSAAYTFHAVGPFTPSITGLVGYQDSQDKDYLAFNGFDNYWYWNAGLTLAVDKISFDFRYWDTADASNPVSDGLSCINHYCDERFVFSTTVTLP